MLESMIGTSPQPGKKLPSPKSIGELRADYFHGADLYVSPANVEDFKEDLGRVLTLKPTMKVYYPSSSDRTFNQNIKGHFAYGIEGEDGVVFQIFSPERAIRRKHPTKSLENSIGNFILVLLEHRYQITKLEYHQPGNA